MEQWEMEGRAIYQDALRAAVEAVAAMGSEAHPAIVPIVAARAAVAAVADRLDVVQAGVLRGTIQGVLAAAETGSAGTYGPDGRPRLAPLVIGGHLPDVIA